MCRQQWSSAPLLVWAALCAFVLFPGEALFSGQVTLAWDPNPEPDLAGYRIHWGMNVGAYEHVGDVGTVTTTTVGGLRQNSTYRFAATAYNTSGLESGFSNEIAYTVPNEAPTIGPAADQTALENTVVGPVGFTVSDGEEDPGTLAVTASSSNPALVPQDNLILGGSGADRTVTATPIAGACGSTTVTLTVSDGQATATTRFTITLSPEPCNVVDDFDQPNDLGSVTYRGDWSVSTAVAGYWGPEGYHHDGNVNKGTQSVQFEPNLPHAGQYQVAIWYTAHSARANNVPVDVVHRGGTTTVRVNQQANGSQWVGLGAYGFAAGRSGNVTVRTTGTSGVVVADAVRFCPVAGVIVDDDDATGVTVVGDWSPSTTVPNHWDAGYLHDSNTGQGTKSVTFQPTLPVGGNFQVSAWWTAHSARASNVPVDVVHNGGTTTVTLNQQLNGARWNSLGTFAFEAGTAGSVRVRTTGTDGVVAADAVRFHPVAGVIVGVEDVTGVTVRGSWTPSMIVPNSWGTRYLHDGNTGQGTKSVEFKPNLAQAGWYEVAIWFTAYTGRASNVPVDVVHHGGTTTVLVNQQINGAQWNSLGTFPLDAGTAGTVRVRTTDADGVVVADAVRFVEVPFLTSDLGGGMLVVGPASGAEVGEAGTKEAGGGDLTGTGRRSLAFGGQKLALEARVVDGHVVVEYVRGSGDRRAEYVLEASEDLVNWMTTEGWLEEQATPADEATERVQARELVPLVETPRRFYRLRAVSSGKGSPSP